MLRWCRRLLPALLICAALPALSRAQPAVKPEELVKQGVALEKESRFDEARARYQQALTQKPKYAEASFRLGRLYLALDSLAQAEQYLLKARELRYDAFLADRELARVYFRQGKHASAIELLRDLVQRKSKIAEVRLELAEVYFANDNLDEAYLEDSVALRLDPGSLPALMLRGRIRARQREFDQARSDYRAVLTRDAGYYPAYKALGDLFKISDVDSAIHYYRAYLRLRPDEADVNFSLSGLYYQLSQKDLSGLTPPADRSDTIALRAFLRARDSINIPRQAQNSESAFVYVGRAIQLGYDREDIYEFYVKVAVAARKRRAAIIATETVLAKKPTDSRLWALLGQVLSDSAVSNGTVVDTNVLRRCIESYKTASVYDSTMRRRAYAWIGSQYYKQKRYDSSIVYYTRVTEMDPKSTSAWMNLAYNWFYGKNDKVRAIGIVEKVIGMDPNQVFPRVFLMNYRYGEKDWDNAYRIAREILEIAPDNQSARDVKNNIDAMRAALKRKAEEEDE